MKSFAISRRSLLCADTSKGSAGSAVMFSPIQMAIKNGLEPCRYLIWQQSRKQFGSDGSEQGTTLVALACPGIMPGEERYDCRYQFWRLEKMGPVSRVDKKEK